MSEKFTPEKPMSQKERYNKKPAAKPADFTNVEGWSGQESYQLFPPVSMEIFADVLADEKLCTQEERAFFKMPTSIESGNFEVTCCMRQAGDMNRIDKMIQGLDANNPWEPGRVEHLLTLRRTNPELLPAHTVALGTKNRGGTIACLDNVDGQIQFATHNIDWGFNPNYCFLLIRKKK